MTAGDFPISTHDNDYPWSVGEVNRFAREVIHAGFGGMIWVKGALTRLSTSGRHFYSTLKDNEGNQLNIVFFNGARQVSQLGVETGSEVMVCGSLDIYVGNGTFQLMVVRMVPTNSRGLLMQQFMLLKEKLSAEGLFAMERKKPLPSLPQCVAVITSLEQGKAAVHDFVETVLKRMPQLHLRLVGSKMQGPGTAENIVQLLEYLNVSRACDVIVLTRGGGSMEDLWEFNNELLVRAVAASSIPVVTAIGHQIDQTLVDFAADAVAITPTDAAVRITDYGVKAAERLEQCRRSLCACLQCLVAEKRTRLTRASSSAYFSDPRLMYYQKAQRISELATQMEMLLPARASQARICLKALGPRLENCGKNMLAQRSQRVDMQGRVLASLDPHGVLKRGYAILLDEEEHAVRRPADVQCGQAVKAVLAEGELNLTVK